MNATRNAVKTERLARMGLLNEPAGYVDGVNLYEYVGSDPINGRDPLGLRTVKWGDGFTDPEKKRINDSLDRVQKRVDDLLKEIDDQLKNEKCKPVTDALNKLRRIINGMKTDLAGDTFHMKKASFNPDAPLRWRSGRGTDIDFNTKAKTPWNTLNDDDLDSQMFHELTHEQGTDDGEAGDDFNDAHAIDNLMNGSLSSWIPLRVLRSKSKCPCPTTQPG